MAALESPYADGGEWLRGNVHTHTTESDGDRSVEAVIETYEERGYDFLAISDHDVWVDPAAYDDATSMTLVPAVEVTANGPHVLHVGAPAAIDPDPDRAAVFDAIESGTGFGVANHPNWERDYAHYPHSLLSDLDGVRGIEVYNGVIERHPGSALATDRWDRLLSAGCRVWGYATDDFHRDEDAARGWCVVQADRADPRAIVEALGAGRCYGSTGVSIESIDVDADGGSLSVRTSDAAAIRLISDHGVVQRTVADATATFDLPEALRYGENHTYVRVECHGRGGETAWTQPFVIGE